MEYLFSIVAVPGARLTNHGLEMTEMNEDSSLQRRISAFQRRYNQRAKPEDIGPDMGKSPTDKAFLKKFYSIRAKVRFRPRYPLSISNTDDFKSPRPENPKGKTSEKNVKKITSVNHQSYHKTNRIWDN